MTPKIEIIGDSLSGPYTIKINDTIVNNVEGYSLFMQDGVHKVTITLITDDFRLRRGKAKS